ncbi:hypothetical protein FALBO_17122 [Fusarium albosuccineum]|uniref:NAD(P)-binding domain-containing protein n=1 Tax=Fusarium albosuccineum TaxID=1237068 RepID=A0A8H4NPD8_9HYPO|nr:hypothetical protein FALBO_17122 [Fusarium albosuccineum]
MHIFVIGGTGRNGSLAVHEALSRGHTVTALVRNPSTATLASHPSLTLIKGTPTSKADIVAALTTTQPPQAIITTLSQARTSDSPFAPLRPDTTPDLLSASMRALLAAISEANLPTPPKLVINSSQGVGSSWRSMNLPTKAIFSHGTMALGLKDHDELDQIVRNSGLPFVSPRPCMLKEGDVKPVKVWPEDGKGCPWMPMITRGSVGKWLVDAAESNEWDGTAPVITN